MSRTPEDRIAAMGLVLPAPVRVPEGLHLPFAFANRRGERVAISGHPRQDARGAISGPYGQLGRDLGTAEGAEAARDIALSVLANLKSEIGELSRVAGWVRVFGMVNSAPGYSEQHLVLNGFSDLIVGAFGPDVGRHARSAIGVAGLPMNFAIEIEAEVVLAS
ncbi:RidA family protein [Roseibacterium sp. SDUM158017]|uniref:RidA family protein n=1 Tax=Roseicyclus salinarum TaxID=3036773 RepID=UPI00241584EF|nr:RidA family protein [Roseibacterium sp. SDUM158017]MDG4649406.1 RidA family protein [Roseibacterium sp. SDUM158017]